MDSSPAFPASSIRAWEQGISELQNLPLRVFYAKNKIQGGLLPIETVGMDNPYRLLEPGMSEDEFREHVNRLPFGGRYLVRRAPTAITENIQTVLPRQSYPKREEARQPAPPKPSRSDMPVGQPEKTPKQQIEPSVMPRAEAEQEGAKGSSRHQYLQSLIKKAAEEKGYKAIIEQPTPDGQGRIDVSLERDGKRIACEISVTTTSEHELENIEKCLRAGYEMVFVCSFDEKNLDRIRELAINSLAASDTEKVNFLNPMHSSSILKTKLLKNPTERNESRDTR